MDAEILIYTLYLYVENSQVTNDVTNSITSVQDRPRSLVRNVEVR